MEEFAAPEINLPLSPCWSMSRRKQFAYCPEAYYLYYGAALNEVEFWDEAARRRLCHLKQLKSIQLWLDAVWNEMIFEYCYHFHVGGKMADLESDLRSIAQRKLSYLRFSLQEQGEDR
ncbi:MAG: hypothetical protein RRY34_09745, partial [Victivallaceae bacterium]